MTLLSERLQKILDETDGLTQVALASAAGVSKQVINQCLDGKIKSVNIEAALRIEETLGYNHIWVMIGRGDIRAPKKEGNVVAIRPQLCYLEPDEMEIITCYRESTETGALAIRVAASSATKKPRLDNVRSN